MSPFLQPLVRVVSAVTPLCCFSHAHSLAAAVLKLVCYSLRLRRCAEAVWTSFWSFLPNQLLDGAALNSKFLRWDLVEAALSSKFLHWDLVEAALSSKFLHWDLVGAALSLTLLHSDLVAAALCSICLHRPLAAAE